MAIGLPLISVLYFFVVSKPMADLASKINDVDISTTQRIDKLQKSDAEQHDELIKHELSLAEQNRTTGELSNITKELALQLKDFNSVLVVLKDRTDHKTP